jgi:glutamate dehydrogenase (NADP+)
MTAEQRIMELFGGRFSCGLVHCPLPADALAELVEPQRIVSARISVPRAGQSPLLARGWRLCLSDLLGPTKGGVRFHPGVNQDNLLSLSARIFLKCAVNSLPHGGAAGGVAIDPKTLSSGELEGLSRGYVRAFADVIGAERDILSPDLGTGPTVMAWMSDELRTLRMRHEPAAINGKPPGAGGIAGRHGATALGVGVVLRELFARWHWEQANLTFAIQGFGAAGGTLAEYLSQAGMRVVAVSDSSAGWYNASGIDVMRVSTAKRGGVPLSKLDPKGATQITPRQVLEARADVVVAAALGGQVDAQIAQRMQCRAVVEVANSAVTSDADSVLESRCIHVVPDLVVNAGGITASHLEWVQNRTGRIVAEPEVRVELESRMAATAQKLVQTATEFGVTLPVAAQIMAIEKLRFLLPA